MNGLTTNTPVALSAQVLVNCNAGGSCNGGNPADVYAWAHSTGLQHVSCEQYTAKNLNHEGDCEAIDTCRDCSPPAGFFVAPKEEDCYAVEDTKYYIGDHYSIQGEDAMKTEIFMNGPISCGIHVSDAFEAYTGGIYSEEIAFPVINHEISVVGFGHDSESGEDYWIGRNSWGTYWGEWGFFRMKMGGDGLCIQCDCVAGIPTYDKPASTYTQ